MDRKPTILFLSTGNSTRSQMAEGFVRSMAGDQFEVMSAGIEPSDVNSLAVETMSDAGIDISHQKPKNVTESLREHFAYVITVCDMGRERAPIFPFTPNLIHWSLEDPALANGSSEEKKRVFVRVRDQIRDKVQNFISEFWRDHQHTDKAASA